MDILDNFTAKMTYTDIDDKLKYKVFDIQRNQKDIDLIKVRVNECRKFIDELKNH